MAAVPQAPPPPDVPLPEALLATPDVPEARLPDVDATDPADSGCLSGLEPGDTAEVPDPSAANGAAAGPA